MAAETEVFAHLEELLCSQTQGGNSSADFLRQLGTSSISIAIRKDGRTSWNSTGPLPCNEDTLFQACSISKAITSLAVVKLAQEGTLDLDVAISKYLSEEQMSWICTYETRHLAAMITLRHLLTHTSGLAVPHFQGYTGNVPTISEALRGSSPANNLRVQPVDIPGRSFSYSGGGFTVIQLILTTMLKEPFPDLMQRIILNPLGMTRSHFGALPITERNYAKAFLTGYTPADAPAHIFVDLAAAGLWSTPADLLKAVATIQKSLLDTSRTTEDKLLTHEWAKALLTTSQTSPQVGLGWQVFADSQLFAHGGNNDPGYRCNLFGYNDGKGICIMTNSREGEDAYCKILWAIAYLEKWPGHFGLSFNDGAPLVDRNAKVNARWKRWKGRWDAWEIFGDTVPLIKWSNGQSLRLLVAAKSPEYDFEFVIEGTQIVVQLGTMHNIRILRAGKSNNLQGFERS